MLNQNSSFVVETSALKLQFQSDVELNVEG